VWQAGGIASVVDPEGHVIPEADARRFPELPLVVGEGAGETAASILPLLQSRPRLNARVEALVRVDGRRWDIRLKDGGLIQLPATGEDAALIQLDQLDRRSRLLELGFARIDLRDPQMIAVRPRGGADGAGA
jgi:cell division protein FtsQ